MSMSTHVVGFQPPDAEWEKMKRAYDACIAAGVEPPEAVVAFFGDEEPDPMGREVDIDDAVREWKSDMRHGLEVDMTKLPSTVKRIRFYNAW